MVTRYLQGCSTLSHREPDYGEKISNRTWWGFGSRWSNIKEQFTSLVDQNASSAFVIDPANRVVVASINFTHLHNVFEIFIASARQDRCCTSNVNDKSTVLLEERFGSIMEGKIRRQFQRGYFAAIGLRPTGQTQCTPCINRAWPRVDEIS